MDPGPKNSTEDDAGKRDSARARVENLMAAQGGMGTLRFIVCGSVDDGKSTLAGRMVWESQQLCEDQIAALRNDSEKYGIRGEDIDFALLADGLDAEHEQNITIDVAYRYFSTTRRKFIVVDTPGHGQYTRNMITGASAADAAVLLVDACRGVLTQTRRHAYLVSLMGIRHVVLAINKMDMMGFDEGVFDNLEREFRAFAEDLGFEEIVPIPLSALKGDNVLRRSSRAPWYQGPALLEYLEEVDTGKSPAHPLVFPVQWVNRPNPYFWGFAGTIAEGQIRVGDTIRVTSSGQTADVLRLVTLDRELDQASQGQAVTLVLDREVGISRGDVLSLARSPLDASDQFEATLVWMHEEPGMAGRTYDLRLATQWVSASITAVSYRINVDTLAHEPAKTLEMNDICVCKIATAKPVAFDAFVNSPTLGAFILVDRLTDATVAAGLMHHGLRRARNIYRQALSIGRSERERLNGHSGMLFWLTGYPGSGKSTIANALEVSLHADGYRTYILDGDNLRHGLNKDLGFKDADRVENIRRAVEVARILVDAGIVVITAFISPFQSEREFARSLFENGDFVEVFVDAPLEICEARDPKGLYKKARAGVLPNLTGVGSRYEPPVAADVHLRTAELSIDQCVEILRNYLGSPERGPRPAEDRNENG